MAKGLIDDVKSSLREGGVPFVHLEGDYSFNFAIRKGSAFKAILRVEEDAKNVSKRDLDEIRKLSVYVNASPVVVSRKFGEVIFSDDIVYSYRGVNMVSYGAFKRAIKEGIMPIAISLHGKVYYKTNGEAIAEARRKAGMSLEELSRRTGVPKRWLSLYESGALVRDVRSLRRLEEELKVPVIARINFLMRRKVINILEKCKVRDPILRSVAGKLINLGFSVYLPKRAPMDIVATNGKMSILGGICDRNNFAEKRKQIRELGRILKAKPLMIVENCPEFAQEKGVHKLCEFLRAEKLEGI